MARPYTPEDQTRAAEVVKQLHGVKGFDAWVQHVAQALADERERCAAFVAVDDSALAEYLRRKAL